MATIEEIYSQLIKEGVNRGLEVVAEFCVAPRSQLFEKKIDVAWVRRRDEPDRFGSLRRWKIVAAFEIEGYDVPLDRLHLHTAQFRQLWEEEKERFPCVIPLYTKAYTGQIPFGAIVIRSERYNRGLTKQCAWGALCKSRMDEK